MAANRECGYLLSASQSISALFQGCSLQKTWLPQSLASEGVIWTWNNLSLSGQGSNSATCRTCRVSLRRSEWPSVTRSGSRCPQTFSFCSSNQCSVVNVTFWSFPLAIWYLAEYDLHAVVLLKRYYFIRAEPCVLHIKFKFWVWVVFVPLWGSDVL
jgi:hypothetical protein